MENTRTDLALEEKESSGENIDGFESNEMRFNGIIVTRCEIKNENASKTLNKPIGKYVTVEFSDVSGSAEKFKDLVSKIAYELKEICSLQEGDSVLIAGLGNEKVTPDALGPRTGNFIMATRHLKENAVEYYNEAGLRQVSVITPGVLGQTGIETAEIIKGIIKETSPKLVIVIDSLASRKMKRLGTTIQISDSGITPGGGVDNARKKISKENLGVPVISVGIPTVVDAATLSCDVIESVLSDIKSQASEDKTIKLFSDFDAHQKYELIKESLVPYNLNLVVTPKDIDFIIDECAKILGFALNMAMQDEMSVEEIESFLA